jgi:hypothetical protein
MEQRSEDYERQPANGQCENHPASQEPSARTNESRSLLHAIKRASANQGEIPVRPAVCDKLRLGDCVV